jgi:SanA protein
MCLLALSGLAAAAGMHAAVCAEGAGRIVTPADAPRRRVAVVLGARVYRNGGLSHPVRLRLRAALALYRAGKVERILVSGDNGRASYNEPEVMRRWLVGHGVAPEHVRCDYAGFRTLDTCARARLVWRLERPVLVSQRFHLARALYLADAWGLDALGVSADGPDGWSARRRDRLREPLARILAWLDVNLFRREPRFLGPREHI